MSLTHHDMLGIALSDTCKTVLSVDFWTLFARDFAAGPWQGALFWSWQLLLLQWVQVSFTQITKVWFVYCIADG